MAGLRRITFIDLEDLNALPFRLVNDHVGELGEGPGVQALVELLPIVDLRADTRQPANGNRIHPRLTAPFHKVFADQMQQMVDLPRLFAFDLMVPL